MRLDESLAALVKSEPRTKAAQQAKKLGLRYMGFGRYGDRKGKIKFTVDQQKDMLVPYKSSDELQKLETQMWDFRDAANYPDEGPKGKDKAVKAKEKYKEIKTTLSDTKKQRSQLAREISKNIFFNQKKEKRYADALSKFYKPELFDENELQAIQLYTDESAYINRYVYGGHEGVAQGKTGTVYADPVFISKIHAGVALLDSAFDQTETPIPFTTYTGLSHRYDPKNFKVGQNYIFKGYISTSLSSNTAIDGFAHESGFFLQIDVPKGAKGIYLEGLSSSKGEYEFLLPRGTTIRVLSGPHTVDSAMTDPWTMDEYGEGPDDNKVFYHCELVVDKEEE